MLAKVFRAKPGVDHAEEGSQWLGLDGDLTALRTWRSGSAWGVQGDRSGGRIHGVHSLRKSQLLVRISLGRICV